MNDKFAERNFSKKLKEKDRWSSRCKFSTLLSRGATLPRTFIALPRFKFLYIGNGNKVFILGVSWYQSNAFTFRSSCEIVIEYLSMHRRLRTKRGLKKKTKTKTFYSTFNFPSKNHENEKPIRNIDRKIPRSLNLTILNLTVGRSVTQFAPHPFDPISMLHEHGGVVHEARPYTTARHCTRIVGGVVTEKAWATWSSLGPAPLGFARKI